MAIREQNQDLEPEGVAPESMHFTILLRCLRDWDRDKKEDKWTSCNIE